jgi:imidazole glycerol-phosphate synthase subunit HisH
MGIVIIKYNAGNVQSVQFALRRLHTEALVTDDAALIQKADKVIFPGVGHARTAMESLQEKGLDKLIKSLQQPVLGICVGMQLLCTCSAEDNTTGLGIIDTEVKKFVCPEGTQLKIPQMGWNSIYDLKGGLFKGVKETDYVYYVHSYYAVQCASTIATTNYSLPYSAALQKNNFYGVQFHTEKSAAAGQQILQNFLNL